VVHRLIAPIAYRVVLVLAAALVLVPVRGAYAGIGPGATCAHRAPGDEHQATLMCINGQNGEVYGGGFTQFVNDTLFIDTYEAVSPQNGHINAEMWVYTGSAEQTWIEVGLRAGIYHPLDPNGCNCQAYARFWAEIATGYGQLTHLIAYTSPNLTNHTYQVQRNSTNTKRWDVHVDFNLKGSSAHQTSDRAYEITTGIETVFADSNHNYSGKFDFRTLEYRLLTSATWPKWPYSREYNGFRCTATNVPPCLWSRVVSSYEYKAQKLKYGQAVPTS
jgi:hypothetical protein